MGWIILKIKGVEHYIRADEIVEIYVNADCTWLSISNKNIKDIVFTANNLASSDILGNPFVVEAAIEDIKFVRKELGINFELYKSIRITPPTLDNLEN
jgi:hypothetical protein